MTALPLPIQPSPPAVTAPPPADVYQLAEVTFTYPSAPRPALTALNLRITSGSILAILGPNGAGKSTLMDLLLRWKQPTSGHITLQGKPLTSLSRSALSRQIALVPQDEPAQFPFSVIDYVLFARAPRLNLLARPAAADFAIARTALEDAGIAPLAARPITSLSGGERQLMLLARAIAQQTSVLLLDEPTSSLDPANTARVIRILRRLHARGDTLIFTTHDPSLAAEIATHAALLRNGQLLASGPVDTVLTAPALTELYATPMQTLRHPPRTLVFRA